MRAAVYAAGGIERMWRTAILPLLEEHHYGELSAAEVATRYGYAAIAHRVDLSTTAVEADGEVAGPPTEGAPSVVSGGEGVANPDPG